MRRVRRDEIVDYATWADDVRPALLQEVLAAKAARRVHVGEYLTFLFENALTIRYQVQEMMRVERIVKEAAIQHELDTYNELLGDRGQLGCVLLIEIDDPDERKDKLTRWLALPQHVYARLGGGEQIRAVIDDRQIDEDRVSSVQYLKFPVGGEVPVAIGCDLPDLTVEAALSEAARAALRADLDGEGR